MKQYPAKLTKVLQIRHEVRIFIHTHRELFETQRARIGGTFEEFDREVAVLAKAAGLYNPYATGTAQIGRALWKAFEYLHPLK